MFLMYRVELKDVPSVSVYWCLSDKFLMYRVELKDALKIFNACVDVVPNVPCGVESREILSAYYKRKMFLMYRVELKVNCYILGLEFLGWFLMYRVELKVVCNSNRHIEHCINRVPNVPCGVESFQSSKLS